MSGAAEAAEGVRRFRPYPEYKDSGVGWLGNIPAAWAAQRLRFAVALNPSKSAVRNLPPDTAVSFLPMESVGEYGGLVLDKTRPLGSVLEGYTYFRDGDVVLAKITPCFENGKGALVVGLENTIGFGTTELTVVRPGPTIFGRFLFYVTVSEHFRCIGGGEMYGAGGQKRVPEDFIRSFEHPLPELDEQQAIAEFLDRETGKIDALVAKKERLIELLQEKRTALITHAVTKGLDPTAPTKPSGIDWLGDIPAHWRPQRIGRLFRQSKRQGYEDLTVLSVYRDYGVIEKASRDDNINKTPENLTTYQLVEVDDLVINKMKAWQGSLGVAQDRGITSPDYVVYTPTHSENPRFLHHLLRDKLMADVYRSISNGIRPAQWRLEPDKFCDLTVFLPSLDEQAEICSALDSGDDELSALIDSCKMGVDLVNEFRTALISAAVTGKIHVREDAA